MKKTRLLSSIFAISSLAAVVPMVCSCTSKNNTQQTQKQEVKTSSVSSSKYCKVVFEKGDADKLDGTTIFQVKNGRKFGSIDAPTATKTGAKCTGWIDKNTNDPISPSQEITADKTLVPVFDVEQITITFDAAGGTASKESTKINPGDPIGELPTATKEGYVFSGWYQGTTKINETATFNVSTTLVAHWSIIPVNYFTVTFDSNGGTTVLPMLVKEGETISSSPTTINIGSKFVGWFLDDIQFVFGTQGTKITSNITLTAKWEICEFYSVVDNKIIAWKGLNEYAQYSSKTIYGNDVITGASISISRSQFNYPIIINENVTSIGKYFLYGCYSFNQPITFPKNLKSIDESFLYDCNSFNQPLTIPSTVEYVGDYFLGYNNTTYTSSITIAKNSCLKDFGAFNTLKNRANINLILTNSGITFENGFMYNSNTNSLLGATSSFNGQIPDGCTHIGSRLLSGVDDYTTQIIIPSSVTSIGEDFLAYCYDYNKPIVLSEGLETIGDGFCTQNKFNDQLTIPSTVKYIGGDFMQYNTTFNKPITIPSTVEYVGGGFLNDCEAMVSTITINNNPEYWVYSNSTLASLRSSAAMYTTGITIAGPYAAAFKQKFPDSTATSYYRKLI